VSQSARIGAIKSLTAARRKHVWFCRGIAMSALSKLQAALGNQPLFTLTNSGDKDLRVVRFTASERLSGLYEVHVELAGPEMDLSGMVDTNMTLEIAGLETPRFMSGICASFEYVGHTRDFQLYEARIVPWLWRLQHRRTSRIFQEMTTPDIVKKVLTDGRPGLDRLPPRPGRHIHPAQLLCAIPGGRPGVPVAPARGGRDLLLLRARQGQAHPRALRPRRRPPADPRRIHAVVPAARRRGQRARGRIHTFRFGEQIRPGGVALRDFNLHKPSESRWR
jgi:type VI secretion system secreted protein VgrG